MSYLQQQSWPGNVRELKNVVRKALLLARGRRIGLEIISKTLDDTRFFRRISEQAGAPAVGQPLAAQVSELLDSAERGEREDVFAALMAWAERHAYEQAFRLSQGDQTKAAKLLGVSRTTARDRFARFNLGSAPAAVREEQLV